MKTKKEIKESLSKISHSLMVMQPDWNSQNPNQREGMGWHEGYIEALEWVLEIPSSVNCEDNRKKG